MLQWDEVRAGLVSVWHVLLPHLPSLCLVSPVPVFTLGVTLCLLLQMGACLVVYSSAWTPEPTQLSARRGSQVRGTARASEETTLEKRMLLETDLSC